LRRKTRKRTRLKKKGTSSRKGKNEASVIEGTTCSEEPRGKASGSGRHVRQAGKKKSQQGRGKHECKVGTERKKHPLRLGGDKEQFGGC